MTFSVLAGCLCSTTLAQDMDFYLIADRLRVKAMILRLVAMALRFCEFFLAILAADSLLLAVEEKPNIVFILCDDLGIGDVQCFNPDHGKIKTPSMDQMASEGMMFTDAHSGSSVCTPTRYGLLTGRYSWRTTLQQGVVQGFEPCLIKKDRPTLASFLRKQGYRTGIVGKWHLNMRFLDPNTGDDYKGKPLKFTAPVGATIPDGPVARGFDYFFGIHHARSMKAIIKQDKVTEHDEVINFLPRTAKKCIKFIQSSAKTKQPYFLYVPLGSPHTPIVPTPEWEGKSGLGKYADFVMQTDHVIGQILKTIDQNDPKKNTLVILASDNGCSRVVRIKQLADKGHKVSAQYRGSKADAWEGGHRIPFVARWPGKISPGSKCNELICLTDLFATTAAILKVPAPKSSCQDSVSFLPALSGQPIDSPRAGIIHHSISGHFAYRSKEWKLILARGSGGWSGPNENKVPVGTPEAQLYDLTQDQAEQSNRYADRQEIAKKLLAQLKHDVFTGRSTPGPKSKNDIAEIELWKSGRGDKQ